MTALSDHLTSLLTSLRCSTMAILCSSSACSSSSSLLLLPTPTILKSTSLSRRNSLSPELGTSNLGRLVAYTPSSFQIRCKVSSTDEPKTKRSLLDNASNLLTNLLSDGRLGEMPTAEGGYKGNKDGFSIPVGTDLFISVYNLHRSPYYWDRPHEFEPERFLNSKKSDGIEGWAGFDPARSPGAMYPNEIIADFAFLPFGGGPRKCVGDQFALMEFTIALSLLLQKFDVELRGSPDEVELVTGATIHTKNGLWCKLRKRT